MSVAVTAGSGTTIAADVYGSAAAPSSGQQVQWVGLAPGTAGALAPVSNTNPVQVVNQPVLTPSANFNRPADTTAYASGDLVANSTTAGSVTPMSWTVNRVSTYGGRVRRARLKKSGTTTTNATFRLHLYTSSPTIANGDNAAWSTTNSTYLGSFDLDMTASTARVFSDSAGVIAAPSVGSEINFVPSTTTIYGLLEARAAYTPASGETFTCELEIQQD